MRFACDEMLQSLGRWLRAAGYDTLIAAGLSDRALLDACAAEERLLVTKDRRLAERAPRVALLSGNDEAAHAQVLAERFGVDWTCAPFTRCLMDNTPLRPATEEEIARMPGETGKLPGPMRTCPACGRLYWPGSHVRRMQARLEAFARAL